MPARLVHQPVVHQDGARFPLSATLIDPGRPEAPSEDDDGNPILVPQTYVHVSAISNGLPGGVEPTSPADIALHGHCLSLVAGVDMSNMDAENSIVTLFEAGSDQPLNDIRDWLGSTPSGLGWNNAKQNRIRNRITNSGGDATGLTSTTPLWRWVNAAGLIFSPTWDVRVALTTLAGA